MTRKLIYFGAIVYVLWLVLAQVFPGTFSSDTHKQDLRVAKDLVNAGEKAKDLVVQGKESVTSSVDNALEDNRASLDLRVNEHNEPVIYEGELWDAKNQRFLQQQVVEVQTKFPLLVRQKIWKPSDAHPSGRIFVGQNAFVADHVLVRMKEGYSESYIAQVMRSEGMEIRKRLNNESLYLIEFPVVSYDSWNKAVARLRELEIVQSIAPDLLGGVPNQ